VNIELALGEATAKDLPPGRYRAIVRSAGELCASHDLTLPADAPVHRERIELWPAAAVVCTVDVSALPADQLAGLRGGLVLLDGQEERSYFVDATGKRMNYTPNTGAFRLGGDMTFRLERVTPNVDRRLYVPHDELFGETWFRAKPGEDTHVTVRVEPVGRLAFALPVAWSAGTIEVDRHDGASWRHLHRNDFDENAERVGRGPTLKRPAGEVHWRVRFWPKTGGDPIERTGTTTVTANETATVRLD
jgi:hypothetical protein